MIETIIVKTDDYPYQMMRFLDGTGIALSPNATSESTIANLYALRGFSLKQSEHLRTSRESAYLPYRGTQSNLAKLTLAVADISTTISNMGETTRHHHLKDIAQGFI